MSVNNEQWIKTQKKIMGYFFNDKKYLARYLGRITEKHIPKYWDLYQILENYYRKHGDIITDDLVEANFTVNNISIEQITAYQASVDDFKMTDVSGGEAEFSALKDLLDEFKKRQELMVIATNIYNAHPHDCSSKELDVLEHDIKSKILTLTSENSDIANEGFVSQSALAQFEKYQKIKNNPELIEVIPTGFKKIDSKEGGFRYGELVYVIGRKGEGKSILLINLGKNAWLRGKNVIIFTLEISKEDYERRLAACTAMVSSNGLKNGKLNEIEEKDFREYCQGLSRGVFNNHKLGKIYVVDVPSYCTPALIDSKIDEKEKEFGIKFDVVISDYAGIMMPNVHVNEKRHVQGQIALDLKRIARRRQCVVISAAQMSREGRKEEKADTAHVAESDQVSDHIDWGIAIRSKLKDADMGIIQSFKTRDAGEFEIHFKKAFDKMTLFELEGPGDEW